MHDGTPEGRGALDYRLRPPGLYRDGAPRTRPPGRLSRFWQ
ncbi:hypothetical protein C7S13_6700 [Burkholderia cepacia]|nr:hypothetical protein [Burkholderia cepacia]QOH39428.1 hypothetical protein C7S14_0920 [Burkholderia cepacia]